MSETKESADKTLLSGTRKPLSLKRTEPSGHVQQSFSHGRKNVVVVERKKRRTISSPGQAGEADAPETTAASPGASARPQGARESGLRPDELDARKKALAANREREVIEAQLRAKEDKKTEEERAKTAAQAALEAKSTDGDTAPESTDRAEGAPVADASSPEVKKADVVAKGQEAPAPAGAPVRPEARKADVVAPRRPGGRPAVEEIVPDDDDLRGKKKGVKGPIKSPVKVVDDRRERVKLTINNFDREAQERSLASLRRKRERDARRAMGISQTREKIMREVIIPEVITIQELANRMTERSVDVIKLLMKQGAMHQINDVIDADTAELIVQDFGHTPKRVSEADVEEGFIGATDSDENLQPRAPVVTIMGHVDHGKTSLLDALRQANVASGEAGGITQHIGAYQVVTPAGQKITFIDTPGHEAFTAMRARGAKVTDIVILVVAADDGVMPQTVEAINHAKAAHVPMIVAINKIDKPDADPNRVRTGLLQHEIVVESMSGETLEVPVSALKKTGLDKLLEAIALQSELLDLKTNPDRSAEGFVIEAKLERGRGPVGTLLVQRGTLRVGDIVVAGSSWGRVRALIDDKGANTPAAGPSVPVEVLGFDSAPDAGDQFAVVENEARAREITDYRDRKRREALGSAGTARTLEQMMQQLKEPAARSFRCW